MYAYIQEGTTVVTSMLMHRNDIRVVGKACSEAGCILPDFMLHR